MAGTFQRVTRVVRREHVGWRRVLVNRLASSVFIVPRLCPSLNADRRFIHQEHIAAPGDVLDQHFADKLITQRVA